ncbi:hypothetical protein M527_13400 [Sphingobium indicum IP26]|nr:hypothetical protein M527_24600 [Sphingobium indicum IP26]EPR18236.1 hypothetical protein M527_13400 [Sphingobium indicum IP26]
MVEGKFGGASGKGLGGPALRTFFNLAGEWSLTEQEQMKLLGLTSRSTFQNWEAGGLSEVSRATLERISYLLGIYKAINILLPDRDRANAWMRTPNKAHLFGGQSALSRMTSGSLSDFILIRQYLDAERV